MARTEPHHDWHGDIQQPRTASAGSTDWENLRNELVSLLDQVEGQVAVAQSTQPAPRPVPSPEPQAAPFAPNARHSAALRSVRNAVERLSERSEEPAPMRRANVSEAIDKIRARQNKPALSDPAPARSGQTTDYAALAQTVASLGQRIESFERQIGARLDGLAPNGDISAQVEQLSDVIELLANAVGESGQVKRIEAQIDTLAEMVAQGLRTEPADTAERLAELTDTIEKLAAHQVQMAGRDEQLAEEAGERQAQALKSIELSVRAIYERIDAMEAARPDASAQIERISADMAMLTTAIEDRFDPQTVLSRIDSLDARIAEMAQSGQDRPADILRESVALLRGVVAETVEPRFAALEHTMDAIATRPAPDTSAPLEAQLRRIAERVEDTAAQLNTLSQRYNGASGAPELPNVETLAALIAEKTQAKAPEAGAHEAGVEKADLDALEERLSRLFAKDGAQAEPSDHLVTVKDTIARVDNRIARLESVLNQQTRAVASAPQKPATPVQDVAMEAPAPARRKPDDAMPADPVSGAPRRVLTETPRHLVEAAAAGESAPAPKDAGFRFDPASTEKPAKPQSSLESETKSPFAERFKDEPKAEAGAGTSRSSFIEAARRAARQKPVEEPVSAPTSLIGKAMSRFQRKAAEPAPLEASALEQAVESVREPIAELETLEPAAIDVPQDQLRADEDDEPRPGFITRNRRALLLGTALVVVIILATPLIANRLTAQRAPRTTPPPAAEVIAPAPEAETSEAPASPTPPPAETVSDAGELMSAVRMIDQRPSLTAASLDSATLTAPGLDPIVTAAITPQTIATTPASSATIEATEAQRMPPLAAPLEIEPQMLREAAENGNPRAQFEIGAILTEGRVVEQDLSAAAQWYERAAIQGFAPAQYRLGSLYETGQGVDKDLGKAKLWYEKAAQAGNRMSMHNLASLFASGDLDGQDFAGAARWFEEAAARGLTDSQFNLGMLYARGLGVTQDFEKSYIWFSLAAAAGDEDAGAARDDVARSLSTESIQRLDASIRTWMPAEIDMAANFAPIGSWDPEFDPGPAIANREVIERVQMLLGKLGFEIGTPDGIAGPKTREAIAEFERRTGMSQSGTVNPRLLAVLGSQPV